MKDKNVSYYKCCELRLCEPKRSEAASGLRNDSQKGSHSKELINTSGALANQTTAFAQLLRKSLCDDELYTRRTQDLRNTYEQERSSQGTNLHKSDERYKARYIERFSKELFLNNLGFEVFFVTLTFRYNRKVEPFDRSSWDIDARFIDVIKGLWHYMNKRFVCRPQKHKDKCIRLYLFPEESGKVSTNFYHPLHFHGFLLVHKDSCKRFLCDLTVLQDAKKSYSAHGTSIQKFVSKAVVSYISAKEREDQNGSLLMDAFVCSQVGYTLEDYRRCTAYALKHTPVRVLKENKFVLFGRNKLLTSSHHTPITKFSSSTHSHDVYAGW